jgi:hypothetical protein
MVNSASTVRPNIWVAQKQFFGINCMFRYWRSNHDDGLLSMYRFNIKLVLECRDLDDHQMVIPKGDYIFKEVEMMLEMVFRDKVIVAEDDPQINLYKIMADNGVIRLMVLPDVGLEKIAEGVYNHVKVILINQDMVHRIDIRSVEIDDGEVIVSYIV